MDNALSDPSPKQRLDLSDIDFGIVEVEGLFFEVPGDTEDVELRLPDIPATGYMWDLDLPDGVEITADEPMDFREDTVGGGGTRVLRFRLSQGAVGAQIIATNLRPWEKDEKPRAKVTIDIFGAPPVHPLDY